MSRLRRRMSFANVMSVLAVFIALGGTSYAISQLPKNSVGARQLKKSSVTAAKIKKGAVTGAKIRLSTLGTVPSAVRADSAARADSATDAGTLQGHAPSSFVRGNAQVFSVRRQFELGQSEALVAVPGVGTMSAKCSMGTTYPKVDFSFRNESGETMDQTLEYTSGTDAGTIPSAGAIEFGAEAYAALRMKAATRTAPVTIVVFDLNMAANVANACPVFVQAIASG